MQSIRPDRDEEIGTRFIWRALICGKWHCLCELHNHFRHYILIVLHNLRIGLLVKSFWWSILIFRKILFQTDSVNKMCNVFSLDAMFYSPY